jgi:hypothetical protein
MNLQAYLGKGVRPAKATPRHATNERLGRHLPARGVFLFTSRREKGIDIKKAMYSSEDDSQ